MTTTFRKIFKTKRPTASSTVFAIIYILNILFGYSTSQFYEGSECELKDGSLATCKSFILCRWAMEGLNQRSLTYKDIKRCSFDGPNEIICCGDERPTSIAGPDTGTLSYEGDEDGIYFDDGKFSVFNNRSLVTVTSTTRSTSLSHLINETVKNHVTTTHRSIVTTKVARIINNVTAETPRTTIRVTTTPHRSTSTSQAPRRSTSTTQTPRPTDHATTQILRPTNHISTSSPISSTISPIRFTSQPNIRPTINSTTVRPKTKPTINSFWTEWAPTNDFDVEIFSMSTTKKSSINTETSTVRNSSNLVVSPWLQDILNEAIASSNVSTTTQRSVTVSAMNNNNAQSLGRLVQIGGGSSDIDNEIGGESNNDLSFSRQKTTSTSTVSPVSTSSLPPPRIGQRRRSEIACDNYTTLSSPFLSFNILGGVPTALGEFPHMAALGYPSQEVGRDYDFKCGASIISETYVLTAAHCVERELPTIVRSGKIYLLTNDDDVAGVNSTIAEIISHPNYNPSRRYDDIALIRVSSPIPFGDNVRPACLRTNMSDIDPDIQLIVTGWGKTSVERGDRSTVLLKTNLTGVPLESCNASLLDYNPNDRHFRSGVVLGQICASDPDARRDACQGDSGGPMQIYSPNGMSTIVGVISFGISCGSALPSVYSRVAFYLDWIESIVWPNR